MADAKWLTITWNDITPYVEKFPIITKNGKPISKNAGLNNTYKGGGYEGRFSDFIDYSPDQQIKIIEEVLIPLYKDRDNKKNVIIADILATGMNVPGYIKGTSLKDVIDHTVHPRNYVQLSPDRLITAKKTAYKNAANAVNESLAQEEAKKALDAAKKAFNNIVDGKEPDRSLFPNFKDQNASGKKEIGDLIVKLHSDPNNKTNIMLADLIATGSQCSFYDDKPSNFSNTAANVGKFLSSPNNTYDRLDPKRLEGLQTELNALDATVANQHYPSSQVGNTNPSTADGNNNTEAPANTQNLDSSTNTGNNSTGTQNGTQGATPANTGNNPTNKPAEGQEAASQSAPADSQHKDSQPSATPQNTEEKPADKPAAQPAPQAKETTVHKYAEEDYVRAQKRVEAHIKRGLITKEEADKALAQIQQMEKEGKIPTGLSADGKSTRSNAVIYLYKSLQSKILYHPDEPVYAVENGKVTKQKECSVSEKLGGSNRDLVKGLAEGNASAERIMKTEDAISEKGHAVLGVKVNRFNMSFKPGRNPGYEESKIYTDENGNIVPKPQENTSQPPASAKSEEKGTTGSGNGVLQTLGQNSGGTVNVSQDAENKRQPGEKKAEGR